MAELAIGMSAPAISVIVPTKHRAEVLERSLAAICVSAARLGRDSAEVLVIDDGSTDDNREVVERFASEGTAIRYVPSTSYGIRGAGEARNAGAELARGEILAFTDDDTVCDPDWLPHALRRLRAQPELAGIEGAIVPSGMDTCDPVLARVVESRHGGVFLTANLVLRRDAFMRAGGARRLHLNSRSGWDEGFRQDTDLGLRVERFAGPVPFDPDLVVEHPIENARLGRYLETATYFRIDAAFERVHPSHFPTLLGAPTERARVRGAVLATVSLPGLARRRTRRAAALGVLAGTAVQVVQIERDLWRAGLHRPPRAIASSVVRRLPRSLAWAIVAGTSRLAGIAEVRLGLTRPREEPGP
jgi:GT2 family glycosyltransferase